MITGWKYTGGNWYCFNNDGIMRTGLFRWDSYTYCASSTGEMITGWYYDSYKETWSYYGTDGIRFDDKWLNTGDKWYYFDRNGQMLSNCENVLIHGIDYSFDEDGVCLNPDGDPIKLVGWVKRYNPYITWPDDRTDDATWYYYDEDGNLIKKQWLYLGGNWYYFDSTGMMASLYDYPINGYLYDFTVDGICQNPYDGRPADGYDDFS